MSLSFTISFFLSLSLFEVGGKGSETTTSSTSSTLLWGMKLAAASPAMLNTPFFFFFFKNVYFIFFFFQRIIFFFFFFWHFSTWIDDAKRKWLRFYDSLRSPLWDSLRFFEILWDSLRFSPRATEGIFPRFFLDSLRSVGDARDSSKVFKDPISRLHSLQHLRQSISLESTRRKGFFLPRREMFTRLIACKQHRCCFFKK